MTSSTNSQSRDVIIIGSGPAGLTAAIYLARAQLQPLVIQGSLPGGQLTTTTEVENFPGFPEGIMGPELMNRMQQQAERFQAKVFYGAVTKVDFSVYPYRVELDDSSSYQARSLIFSTGASPRMLGLPEEQEMLGYGLSTCATCDGAFFRDQEIVVVGGGDSACEEAIFLSRFGRRVRLIHRRDSLRASKIMAERVLNHPKIEVIWNSTVSKLIGSRQTGLNGVELSNTITGEKSSIECSGLFYAIGHLPNSALLKGQVELDENGYVITKPFSTETSLRGVFACGDLQDHQYRQAITAAGTGCMAALEAERFLAH